MSSELEAVAKHLQTASSYIDVFGACDGDGNTQTAHIKRVYRKLARVVHPDLYTDPKQKQLAEESFRTLIGFQTAANTAAGNDSYGHVATTVIKTRRYQHKVGMLICHGDMADLFRTETVRGSTVQSSAVKLARSARDSDLMDAETKAYRRLFAADGDDKFHPFFPTMYDSFVYKSQSGTRRGNVFETLDGWFNLEQVRRSYPHGIQPLDMVWMWRKLLWALGYAHQRGLVHGAVWPVHIMIHPAHHGLKLTDWCYSTQVQSDSGTAQPIKAVVPAYQSWYPPEVTERRPPTFGTDIYMAVQSMIYLTGGEAAVFSPNARVPKGMRAFFRGCGQSDQRLRPQSAWQLLAEFDELLERFGGPYYPRRFREFQMPAVTGTTQRS